MGIRIEKRLSVDAPPDAVWAFLIDLHRVAQCLPGASVTERIDDHTYAGRMTVKVGPVSTSYKGKITFERLDPNARTAELTGRGQDERGRGGADLRMTSRLTATDRGTEVVVISEVSVTGMLAQFGRGMIGDVSDRLFETFAERMRRELTMSVGGRADGPEGETPLPPPAAREAAEGLDGLALGARVGGRAAGRLVRRPAFWLAVAVLAVFVSLLLAR